MTHEIEVSGPARQEALHTTLTWLRNETCTRLGELRRTGNKNSAIRIATAENRVRLLDEAIGQADRGTYGFCAECGQEISIERLASAPLALYCARCEETQIGEVGFGTGAKGRSSRSPSGRFTAWRRASDGRLDGAV